MKPIHCYLVPFYFCLAAAVPAAAADEARVLLEAKCTMCHSSDLVAQQRLDRRHWQDIVSKMRSWGAMLSEAEAAALVRYLAAAYPPEADSASKK
jgi:cytochrome c oxidase cbb3-type subunit III